MTDKNLGIKLEIKFRKQELENLQFSQRQEDSKDVIDAYVEATSSYLIHIEPTIFIICYITSSNFISTFCILTFSYSFVFYFISLHCSCYVMQIKQVYVTFVTSYLLLLFFLTTARTNKLRYNLKTRVLVSQKNSSSLLYYNILHLRAVCM